jgi:HEAT repeat protein
MLLATRATSVSAQEKAEEIMVLDQTKLIKILKNTKATEFAKAKACQRLAVIGTKEAVPALAALLTDPKFAHYARFGLEPIPDRSVDEALRRALGQVKGMLQVGVINSIGNRKDVKAVESLTKLMDDSDTKVAAAAASALGRIGSPEAAKALQKAVDYTRTVAGDCLECAEGLVAQGKKDQALVLYDTLLGRSDLPKGLRMAAARGQETARSKQ